MIGCRACRVLSIALVLTALCRAAAGQRLDLTVEAPLDLEPTAQRVRAIDREQLAAALARAGLEVPPRVRVALIADNDPRARRAPPWVVGRAFGTEAVEIFPQRVTSYPYGSLESVVQHEIVHLALTRDAGGLRVPRWFHEGVATTVEAGWGVTDQLRLLVAALDRPTISDVDRLFASEASPETRRAYLLAAALVNDIRQRHGPAIPGAIAQDVARGVSFDDAFLRQTGETVDQAAARAWAGYRRVSRWIPTVTSPSAVWSFILALSFVAFVAQVRRRLQRRRQWEAEEHSSWDD